MSPTDPPGDDPAAWPATYGGSGFVHRQETHAHDVSAGQLWRRVGAWDEVGPLKTVLLAEAPASLDDVADPEAAHMLGRPNRNVIAQELEQLAALFRAEGVEVLRAPAPPATPPNFLFQRDLVLMTPEGALVGRPASPVRAAEPRYTAAALASHGVPILGLPRGNATLEGADALWLAPDHLLVGVGRRTNAEGLATLTYFLGPAVRIDAVPLPRGVQHLLGVVLFLAPDLALIDAERAPQCLVDLLVQRGICPILLPADPELHVNRAMNGVVLAPRRVVLPADTPRLHDRLDQLGVAVLRSPMAACRVAAGAMGCLTAVLLRESASRGAPEPLAAGPVSA